MARTVPLDDSDSLKHRICRGSEKKTRRGLPRGKSNRQNLPCKGKILPSAARQIIPLCRKRSALLLEKFRWKNLANEIFPVPRTAQTKRAALARRSFA
jgi:hypothetical protein